MGTLNVEEIDLADLTRLLVHHLGGDTTEGYVVGRTLMRDALITALECSELEGEQLVDTLIARGFVAYQGEESTRSGPGRWRITAPTA